MAWRLSTLGPATAGSSAGDLFLDNSPFVHTSEGRDISSAPPATEISHSVAAGQAPLAEAGTPSQGNLPVEDDSIPHLSWFSHLPHFTSTPQYSQILPVTEHGGFRDVRVQGYGEQQLHSEVLQAYTTSNYEHQENAGASVLGNDRQGKVLTYPEGEDDAVEITERDMEGLRPTKHLSDTIIDFYIKYLERRLPSEERARFHFFNSFFFAKLFGTSRTSNDIDQCKIDHEQVRKWSAEVNLFEKDFVFIPVVRSSHWSLIIICHLRSLWSAPDERRGSPCILHLDSFGGIHENFKRQVRSYLSKTWMEKRHASDDMDRVLDLCQMKYIRAEVPRQKNGYDCGVYLLHYIEVFLSQPTTLSFAPRKGVQLFTRPEFADEVSDKRRAIEKLILGLKASGGRIAEPQSNSVSAFDRHADNQTTWEFTLNSTPLNGAEDAHGEDADVAMDRNQQVRKRSSATLPGSSRVNKKRKWTDKETSTLLNCKAKGGRYCKENQTGMNWNNVAHKISKALGTTYKLGFTTPSAEQCRRRYETLQKAYKSIKGYCVISGHTFSEITDEEKLKLKLATELTEAQYILIDSFSHKVKPQKRARHSGSVGTGQPSACVPNNAAPPPSPVPAPAVVPAPIFTPAPIPNGQSRALQKQVAIPRFRYCYGVLRSTLVNLIQGLGMHDWNFELEEVCRKLGIVQDRIPSDIREHVFELSARKLVNFKYNDEALQLNVAELQVYKKFVGKVLRKNPDLDIYLEIRSDDDIVSFPEAPVSLCVQRIRVLELKGCDDLQRVDLSFFPELRYLNIYRCHNLEKVTGWEVVIDLGYLQIWECPSCKDFPPVQRLPSLREFSIGGSVIEIYSVPNFNQCVRLWSLVIWHNEPWALNGMDLSTLRFLEVLSFGYCDALTTIHGLSGLHFLTTLSLEKCTALRSVPELGGLKALTTLNMRGSGVEEISGVQELYLLTSLDLSGCGSLKTLPCLGHLEALTMLSITESGVEEIPGVQDLVSLEALYCGGSRLKSLPELHHLPRLRTVWISGTPLSTTSLSSFYYGKECLDFTSQRKRKGFDDDISDISDTENF